MPVSGFVQLVFLSELEDGILTHFSFLFGTLSGKKNELREYSFNNYNLKDYTFFPSFCFPYLSF